jgi:hypothetical protein
MCVKAVLPDRLGRLGKSMFTSASEYALAGTVAFATIERGCGARVGNPKNRLLVRLSGATEIIACRL